MPGTSASIEVNEALTNPAKRLEADEAVVTVICPVFNDEAFCAEAIRSVLAQTLRSFRFIIIDNGSTDRSRSVIESFSDPRISFLKSHINLKSEIMASQMLRIRTKYIAQIYSDDVFEPNKLEMFIAALESSGAAACFSNNAFIDDFGQLLADKDVPGSQFTGDISSMSADEHLYRFYKLGNSLHPVAMVVRSDAYRAVGGVKPHLHSIGDMEFFARLLLNEKVIFLEERLQKIRIRSRGRVNESAPSELTYRRVLGERMCFYSLMKSDVFLSRVERIFLPDLKGTSLPDGLRKWFVGHKIFELGDPDCKLIGMQTIYEAVSENYDEIETFVIASRGFTLGQYMEQLSAVTFATSAEDILSAQEIQRLNAIIVDLRNQIRVISSDVPDIVPRFKQAVFDFETQRDLANGLAVELDATRARLALAETDFSNQARRVQELEQEIASLRADIPAPLAGVNGSEA